MKSIQIHIPKCPKPRKEDYETAEEYEKAQSEYERKVTDYNAKCEDIRCKSEAGEIIPYIRIDYSDAVCCYVRKNLLLAVKDKENEKNVSPIEKLEKQDKRNKEIALEKTVEDTKSEIMEIDMSETKFGADEEKMMYFFLLSSLRKEHFELWVSRMTNGITILTVKIR